MARKGIICTRAMWMKTMNTTVTAVQIAVTGCTSKAKASVSAATARDPEFSIARVVAPIASNPNGRPSWNAYSPLNVESIDPPQTSQATSKNGGRQNTASSAGSLFGKPAQCPATYIAGGIRTRPETTTIL
jgi:hypothetical protein